MRRPVFDRIMERIRSGESDGVVVAKLDRFARTLVGALGTLEEFERQGAVLVSVADNIDLSTPMGKAFLRILLVFAELERDRISESWKTATTNAIARGIHIAKFTPVGYDKQRRQTARTRRRGARDPRGVPDARRAPAPAPRSRAGSIRPRRARTAGAGRRRWSTGSSKTASTWADAYRGENVNRDAHPADRHASPSGRPPTSRPSAPPPAASEPNLLGGIARCAACRYVLAPHRQVPSAGPERTRSATAAAAHTPPASARAREHQRAQARELRGGRLAGADGRGGTLGPAGLRGAADAPQTRSQRPKRSWRRSRPTDRAAGARGGYHAALEARAAAVNQAQAQLQRATAPAGRRGRSSATTTYRSQDRKRILGSSIDAVIVERGRRPRPDRGSRHDPLARRRAGRSAPARTRQRARSTLRPLAPARSCPDAVRVTRARTCRARRPPRLGASNWGWDGGPIPPTPTGGSKRDTLALVRLLDARKSPRTDARQIRPKTLRFACAGAKIRGTNRQELAPALLEQPGASAKEK